MTDIKMCIWCENEPAMDGEELCPHCKMQIDDTNEPVLENEKTHKEIINESEF